MKLIIKGLVAAMLLVTSVVASATQDIQIYTTDNKSGKITGASIEKTFADAGFLISGINDMNIAFNGKFKKTNDKEYFLFTVYKKDIILPLIKVTPDAALITPLSMSIYMNKGSNDISISSLSLAGMSKVSTIPSTNKDLIKYAKLVKATLAKALPNGHFEKLNYKISKPQGKLIARFSGDFEVDSVDDIEDEIEGYQTELEGSLETLGFVIAGFNQLGEEFKAAGYDKYDFFDAYSICKLPVIFEVSRNHPEAGAFAPCTLYMYKEKGSDKIVLAYPSVYNWISSLEITDKASIDVLIDAQNKMDGVLEEINE